MSNFFNFDEGGKKFQDIQNTILFSPSNSTLFLSKNLSPNYDDNNASLNDTNSFNNLKSLFDEELPIFNRNFSQNNQSNEFLFLNEEENEQKRQYRNSFEERNDIKEFEDKEEKKVEEDNGLKIEINLKDNDEKSKKSTIEITKDANQIIESKVRKNSIRIYKDKHIMGRKRKNVSCNENYESGSKHDKYSLDNIRRKVKRAFINSLKNCINILISISPKLPKNKKFKLQKINSAYLNSMKKDLNLAILDLPAKDFLSKEICKKCKKLYDKHNEYLIKLIYEVNDTIITQVLDKSMRELLAIFCNDLVEDDVFKYLKRLNIFIKEYLSKESEEYIDLFKEQANNFENEIRKIHGRNEN